MKGVSRLEDVMGDRVRFVWESEEERKATFRVPGEAMQVVSSSKDVNEVLNTGTLPVLAIMPMLAIPQSPMLCALLYSDKQPAQVKYLPTLLQLWKLYKCRTYVLSVCGGKARSEGDMIKAHETFVEKGFTKWETDVTNALCEFFARMKQGGIFSPAHPEATACMRDFHSLMCDHTYNFIHMMETQIWEGINSQKDKRAKRLDIPLEALLTPKTSPDEMKRQAHLTPQQVATYIIQIQNWFAWKQKRYIDYQLDAPQTRTHIDAELFKKVYEKHALNETQVLLAYMPYFTLWQYAMFLDYHHCKAILYPYSNGEEPGGLFAKK